MTFCFPFIAFNESACLSMVLYVDMSVCTNISHYCPELGVAFFYIYLSDFMSISCNVKGNFFFLCFSLYRDNDWPECVKYSLNLIICVYTILISPVNKWKKTMHNNFVITQKLRHPLLSYDSLRFVKPKSSLSVMYTLLSRMFVLLGSFIWHNQKILS